MTWQYISGFFDGEGSLCHNGKGFRITIPQTNEAVLQSIKTFTGSGHVFHVTKRMAHWKESWVYTISRQEDVFEFLRETAAYVIVKKTHVEKVLLMLKGYLGKKHELKICCDKKYLKAKALRAKGYTYRDIGKILGLDWGHVRRVIIKFQ